MRTGFVSKIPSLDGGPIDVVRAEIDTVNASITTSAPAAGVTHTTETKQLPAYSTGACPHLTIGPRSARGRSEIFQHVPFGQIATALQNDAGGIETNRLVRCQIEIVGYSSLVPWLPADDEQAMQIASVFEWAAKELDIPEHRPFPDRLEHGVVWAVEGNPRRRAAKFGKQPGWFKHCEVPENDHWDTGSLEESVLLGESPIPLTVIRYSLVAGWTRDNGHRESIEMIEPTTLRSLFATAAADAEIRARIRRHKRAGHRVEIAKRKVRKGG